MNILIAFMLALSVLNINLEDNTPPNIEPVVVRVVYESGVGVGENQEVQLLWTPMDYTAFGKTTEESTVSFLPLQHGRHILSTKVNGHLCSESVVLISNKGIESPDNFTITCSTGLASANYILLIPIIESD